MNFETLEKITNMQTNIRKWCLLYCKEKTVRSYRGEDKKKSKDQLDKLKQSTMPNFNYSTDFKKITSSWWLNEIKWYKKHSNSYTHKHIVNGLLYRLLTIFFLNNMHQLGTKKSSGNKKFVIENQKIFKKFMNESIRFIPRQKKLNLIHDIIPLLKKMKHISIMEEINSASYKLHGKDWSIAKSIAIGTVTGTFASIFLGPAIGGYIGNMAGLSGAAATGYGLAFLGGGSVATGGFGMAGGSTLIGLGFGISTGAKYVKKDFVDQSNMMQAHIALPILLAIGRILFENGDIKTPKLIHKTISKRLKKLNQRMNQLEKKHSHSNNLKSTKKLVQLYRKSKDMSETYNWRSGYEVFREVKSWAS